MKITQEFENKLIGRREIKGSLRVGEKDSSITRSGLRAILVKKYSVKDECVIVSKISPHFGDSAMTFRANIYEEEEIKKNYELAHMIKRNTNVKVEEALKEESEEKKEEASVEKIKEDN